MPENVSLRRVWLIGGAVLLIGAFALSGCAGTKSADIEDLQLQITERDQQIQDLRDDLKDNENQVRELESEVRSAQDAERRAREALASAGSGSSGSATTISSTGLLPPARPGECYARVFVPPVYENTTEEVLKREASEKIDIIPAKYDWVEEQVLIKDAGTRLEEVPATYEWTEEQVLVEEAHTEWKKGRGLVEKVDGNTGEIMCLVEVPAQYKTVRKRVLVNPATVKEVTIPAEYKTVKVKKLVEPARTVKTAIPAEYQTVTRQKMITDGHLEWRQVLCETNMGRDMVSKVQRALQTAGHDPGPIDGIIGSQTMQAVKSYQKSKGLAVGGLTYETIKSLGV